MVGLPSSIWVPALVAFLAVALGTVSLVILWEWFQEQQRKRQMVEQLRTLANEPLEGPAGRSNVFRSAVLESPWLRPIVSRVPQLRDAEFILQQAGMSWSLQTLILLSIGTAVGLGSMTRIMSRAAPVALVATVIGALLPTMYVRRRRTKRMNAFEELLPEAIDLVGRALRAGHPLTAGFKMAADDGPEPVAGEFRRVFEEQRFGLPIQDSLLGMADRVNIVDVRILVTAILIQREVGGNLAEILDNLAAVVRARFTIRRQIRVYTAQGRLTMMILMALPPFMVLWLSITSPEFIKPLFYDPLGHLLILAGVIMQTIGYLLIRKIINIKV
ncbi:MAG TPA: type II secretion system F family protein [Gemmatimonadales bacterium]|nr:type II secretion system F family protein [Gemmatimonadales bacterium]